MERLNSIENYLYLYANITPDRVAIISKKIEYSYKKVWKLSLSYSKFLKDSGLNKGDIVVLKAKQSVEYAIAYFAIHLAGGVVASLEKSCPSLTIISVAKQLNSNFIIDDDIKDSDFIVVKYSDIMPKAELLESYDPVFPNSEDSADILFTTGTTGKSKGVELSHKNLVASAENAVVGCEYDKDLVLISPGPLNHAGAIRKLFTTIYNGSTIILLDGLSNIDDFYDALNYDCKKIGCVLVPAFIRIIFQNSLTELGNYKDKIDFIESASAPLPETDKERLCNLLPNSRLYNVYGSSEAGTNCIYNYNKYRGLKNCIGMPLPNATMLIVDKDKNVIESSPSNMGYIAIKGDVIMKGYKNEPELTKEIMTDGVIYTQDIGYYGEHGFIYLIGRDSDVINVGGLKVAPAEIESVVLGIDGIKDCIIIEDTNELIGNAIKLLYVADEDILMSKFVKYLRKYLENYKIPTIYERVEAIKRVYNGKLDRKYYKTNKR